MQPLLHACCPTVQTVMHYWCRRVYVIAGYCSRRPVTAVFLALAALEAALGVAESGRAPLPWGSL